MTILDDPRFPLLPNSRETAFYIHRHADLERAHDAVAGPFSRRDLFEFAASQQNALLNLTAASIEGRVVRFGVEEIIDDHVRAKQELPFAAYELSLPESDEHVVAQRSVVDNAIVLLPLSQAPEGLIHRAGRDFETLVSGLFRYALCSMTRIVLSTHWADMPGWVAVTTRDREKRLGMSVPTALLRMTDDRKINAYVNSGEHPTSSALSVFSFHSEAPAGVLLHAHLLAPVLLNSETRNMAVINEHPRTSQFGIQLRMLFRSGYHSVLRPKEGVWCFESSVEAVLKTILLCQAEALDVLLTGQYS